MTNARKTAQTVEHILRQEMQPQRAWQNCTVTGPVFSTATSDIFQAFENPGAPPVAIKCTSPRDAKEQYEALVQAAALLAGLAHHKAPRPLGMLEASGIVVMEWIEAPSLQHLYLNQKASRAETLKALNLSAELLAHLHAGAHPEQNPLDTEDFLNDIALAFNTNSMPNALYPAMAALEKTAKAVHEQTLDVTTLHGDFKSANLLVAGDSICTIDAALKWKGATLHDIAHFLNQFALDLYHPKGLRLRPHLKAFETSFLQIYQDNARPIPPLALHWIRLQKLVISYAAQKARTSNPLASAYLTVCLGIELKRLVTSFPVDLSKPAT